ncbi:MAG: hypothetical protein K2J48_04925, partial [Muribaculaceae bacterium]|nr:hypothetical protein [Muribaculaceae bacterium]
MNRFSFRFLLGITVFAGLMTGCSSDDKSEPIPVWKPTPKPEPIEIKARQDISLTPQQMEGVKMQNDFAFRLFNEDNKSNSANSLISPLSLTMCLSMAANGASDEVEDEIVANLLPKGGSLDDLNSLNKYLVESLVDVDNSSILTLANSAWVDKNFKLLSPFAESIKTYYNAESSSLDLSSSKAVETINNWVNTSTNGLIPTLFQSVPANTELILINALYFNGAWKDPFEEKITEKGVFNNENGKTAEVEFMHKNNPFKCAVTSDYSVFQLPYGNEAFNFYAVLPAEEYTLNLNAEKWDGIKKELQNDLVVISMPKFEIHYEVAKISEKMENAGISKLFTTSSPLKNTVTPEIPGSYVDMIHKTVFK